MTTRRDELKAELLEKYSGKEPSTFLQFDGFADAEPDCIMHPDKDGDCLFTSNTHELMTGGVDVRILITAGISKKATLRLLKKLRKIISEEGDFSSRTQEAKRGDQQLDRELCPRCGCNTQGTHHPLCSYRDGTPTELTDDAVRDALAVLGIKGGREDVDDIPF